MNRIEYLERLEKLLADIPYTERREALNYYTEYFEDAEKDDEDVIRTLGSPEEVAHNIREELAGKELSEIVSAQAADGTSERGAAREDAKTDDHNSYADTGASYQSAGSAGEGRKETGKKQLEGWQIALIIIGAVVLFPVYGGVIIGGLGACIGVIAGFFGIILGLMAAAVACAIAAVFVFVVAVVKFAVSPLASLFLIGLSIFLAGIAMLCMIASWKSLTVLVPAIFQGIAYIWNSIFHRKERAAV